MTSLPAIFPPPDSTQALPGKLSEVSPAEFCREELSTGGYRLRVEEGRTTLAFSDEGGRQAGLATLAQIEDHLQSKTSPGLEILDAPRLEVRGFMLDISRGRVPTRTVLKKLVRLLWTLKYNQLQLYMEHTFAYTRHPVVWRETGALHASDILWLDQLCREHGIELVPNQNCFGHMEQWLKWDAYMHLAECPDGFEHPVAGRMASGSVLRPSPESARFIDGLLAELLPNFSSPLVNIGCDETWELGQGASRRKVEEQGRRRVFLDHLQRLLRIVHSHDRKALFWADVFLGEDCASVEFIPDAIPVVWGYDPGHPFAENLEQLRSAGYPFLIAPGTSCWNSFGGRWPSADVNIREAVQACVTYDGKGILLTSWGDNGHAYPFSIMLPPLFLGAGCAWNGECPDENLWKALQAYCRDDSGSLVQALLAAGSLDEAMGSSLPNMSGLYRFVLNLPNKLAENPFTARPQQLNAGRAHMAQVRSLVGQRSPDWDAAVADDLELALDLNDLALELASGSANQTTMEACRDRFQARWTAESSSSLPPRLASGLFKLEIR